MKRRRRRNPGHPVLANGFAGSMFWLSASGALATARALTYTPVPNTAEAAPGALATVQTSMAAITAVSGGLGLLARHYGKGDAHPVKHGAYGAATFLASAGALMFASGASAQAADNQSVQQTGSGEFLGGDIFNFRGTGAVMVGLGGLLALATYGASKKRGR